MKKLFGFTMAELLVSMVIIGILMTTAIFTFKPFDKGIKYLYSNTFYTLDRAIYNSHENWIPQDAANRDPFASITGALPANSGKRTERLCEALTEYINTIESTENICNQNQISATANDEQFTDTNLQFTATNGVRYYISQMYPNDNTGFTNEDETRLYVPGYFGDWEANYYKKLPKFFIVYADLNGTKSPNSMLYRKTPINNGRDVKYTDPDIFAFAILDIGRVCPIGVVEVEPRYMTTRIKYRTVDPNDENMRITLFSFPSRPYAYSKAEAWAYYVSLDTDIIQDPMDENADNSTIQGNENHMQITPEEPLSYNDYIKYVIENDAAAKASGSQIYKYLNGKTLREYLINEYHGERENNNGDIEHYINLYFRGDNPADGGEKFFCRWHDIDHCEVFVDRYIH